MTNILFDFKWWGMVESLLDSQKVGYILFLVFLMSKFFLKKERIIWNQT